MRHLKARFLYIAGCFLIFLGVLGLILPVLPGWIFIIVGLILVGNKSKIGGWIYKRLPTKIQSSFDQLRKKWFPDDTPDL